MINKRSQKKTEMESKKKKVAVSITSSYCKGRGENPPSLSCIISQVTHKP